MADIGSCLAPACIGLFMPNWAAWKSSGVDETGKHLCGCGESGANVTFLPMGNVGAAEPYPVVSSCNLGLTGTVNFTSELLSCPSVCIALSGLLGISYGPGVSGFWSECDFLHSRSSLSSLN